jgi:hypothetical protein
MPCVTCGTSTFWEQEYAGVRAETMTSGNERGMLGSLISWMSVLGVLNDRRSLARERRVLETIGRNGVSSTFCVEGARQIVQVSGLKMVCGMHWACQQVTVGRGNLLDCELEEV